MPAPTPMLLSDASQKADTILLELIKANPGIIGSGALTQDESGAHEAAQSIAAFRDELVRQLAKQP